MSAFDLWTPVTANKKFVTMRHLDQVTKVTWSNAFIFLCGCDMVEALCFFHIVSVQRIQDFQNRRSDTIKQ